MLKLVKGLRARLAGNLAELKVNIGIAAQQRHRQALSQLADILEKLRQASLLHAELKCDLACNCSSRQARSARCEGQVLVKDSHLISK